MQTIDQLRAGDLKGSKKLKLSSGLSEFPLEILDLSETLEYLDLSTNKLSELPDSFSQLKNLKIAFFSENDFTRFPEILAQCPKLEMIGFKANKIKSIPENSIPLNIRWLILTNNKINRLPNSIGQCHRLQKFMMAGNRLSTLPRELGDCKNLELLRISANNLDALPDWIFSFPKLSWLAIAGNPFTKGPLCDELSAIPWNELIIEQQLGEGASGIISKARWKRIHDAEKVVAIKIFKGEVTSDGLPEDEMNACIAAASHPNLVKILGKISSHPDGKEGLAFELIPPTYKNLGGPPSFDTCTRDTFPNNLNFSTNDILKISSGIASALAHLHQKGIIHGDLYAHNILVDPNANPLFGDFGAASSYEYSDTKMAEGIEKIEVRAFACLLDDLLERVYPSEKDSKNFIALDNLRKDCFNISLKERPAFKDILGILTQRN